VRAWLRDAAHVSSLWWFAVPYLWVAAGGLAIHLVS
jgi:hypothetical protein